MNTHDGPRGGMAYARWETYQHDDQIPAGVAARAKDVLLTGIGCNLKTRLAFLAIE